MPLTLGAVGPSFMGITGVNEHIEPVFKAVLPSAVVMQSSQIVTEMTKDPLSPVVIINNNPIIIAT